MSVRARVLEHDYTSFSVNIYGDGTRAEVDAAIVKVLPEPKRGTREEWAARFYNTGVRVGMGTVWNFAK